MKKVSRQALGDVANEVIPKGRPTQRVCRILGRSRQWFYNLVAHRAEKGAVRGFNERIDDSEVLPLIEAVMKDRPSYGYKRITAMVNKRFGRQYNRKRIYRLMRKAGLLLLRQPMRREAHACTGKVMVPRPNMRWCSDCFEIHCWNDERVHVAFAMDCCDREVIHFIAAKNDILSDDIQQLMLQAVEQRFGKPRTPHPIQ